MTPEQERQLRLVNEGIERAIAEGRHSRDFSYVCEGCGEWRHSARDGGPLHKTYDGRMLGACCTPASEKEKIAAIDAAALGARGARPARAMEAMRRTGKTAGRGRVTAM